MMPYGDIDLGQHWLRKWLVAWWHQAITWTNVDLSSMEFCGIHLTTILQAAHEISVHGMSLKIMILKLQPHLPGANELIDEYSFLELRICQQRTVYYLVKLKNNFRPMKIMLDL